MIVIDPYEDLPADPEQAFLKLERHFKSQCESDLRIAADKDDRTDTIYVSYIAKVLGAIEALNLETAFTRQLPAISDVNYSTYLDFSKDVEHYRPSSVSVALGERRVTQSASTVQPKLPFDIF